MDMQMNPQLSLAYDFLLNTGNHLFLTGKAGTGKTTFLKHLKEVCPKRMIVVAPTGVAAINAGGVTIHSFFQIPFGPYVPGVQREGEERKNFLLKFNKEKINIIRSLDLLVIDEISMVRADVLDAINDVLRRFKDPTTPFGGVQLLLIGDLQQLAPVTKENEWELLKEHYESAYFFDSKALKECTYHCIELTEVFRQNDNEFIRLLNNIRENRFDDETLSRLNQRYNPYFQPKEEDGYIVLTTHNYQAQQLNSRKLAALPGMTHTFEAKIDNDFPEYSYPTDLQLELKQGAQVMFVKNGSSGQHRYYNGKIGKVAFIALDHITVIDECGIEIQVDKEVWNNVKYTIDPETQEIKETVAGTFTQYPLKTAWAITIHKSQGLTFEHAIIDAAAAFSHGQVYVALSRCKTLEGLVLSSLITRNAMISDHRVLTYSTSVTEKEPRREQIEQMQQEYYLRMAVELFNFDTLQIRLQQVTNFTYTHLDKLYPELRLQFSNTRDTLHTAVTEVGNRFKQQLTRLISYNPQYKEDATIQERIQKGAVYFLEQLDQLFTSLMENATIEIDNKENRKIYNKAIDKLKEELRLKQSVLTAAKEHFTVIDYLKAKALAAIEQPAEKKKKKPERAPKQEKLEVPKDILHPDFYRILREWRYDKARELHLPDYMVLQQKALMSIVNYLPISQRELLAIPGIGKKIVESHGEAIIEMVHKYKEQMF